MNKIVLITLYHEYFKHEFIEKMTQGLLRICADYPEQPVLGPFAFTNTHYCFLHKYDDLETDYITLFPKPEKSYLFGPRDISDCMLYNTDREALKFTNIEFNATP